MNYFRIGLLAGLVLGLNTIPSPARAGVATEQLRATVKDFVTILANTPVAELQATGLPEPALRLVFARFDFSEMAKRSLGPHWKALAQTQQLEFIDGFTRRLLTAYGKTVRSGGDKIQYKSEVRDGEQVTVATQVMDGGEAVPIDYRLHDVGGQWKVFDVVINNVSLVANYRAQFERVIAKYSLQELLRLVTNQEP